MKVQETPEKKKDVVVDVSALFWFSERKKKVSLKYKAASVNRQQKETLNFLNKV